jgi:GT2 family glycosyltransferase
LTAGHATQRRGAKTGRFLAHAIRTGREIVTGYIVDRTDLSRRLAVEILVDGLQIDIALADQFSGELRELGIGDACYGFAFVLRPALVDAARMLEVRLANVGEPVGAPILLEDSEPASPDDDLKGEASWAGGLHLTGWTDRQGAEAPMIRAFIDGELIAECRANRWRHIDRPRPMAVRAFDLWLPQRFAAGKVQRASVALADGSELPGSPVTFVAFERSLENVLKGFADNPGERLQGRLYDRLVPQSLPFPLYADRRWLFQPEPLRRYDAAVAVILFDGERVQSSVDSLDGQSHVNWSACVIPTKGDGFAFDPADLVEFVAEHAAGAEYFVFGLPGVAFDAHALARVVEGFEAHPEASLIYGDIDFVGADGGLWPIAFPAFDYERLLEQGYCAAAFALKRSALQSAVGKSADTVFRLVNATFDEGVATSAVRHLPGAIARVPDDIFAGSQESLRAATSDHLAARRMAAVLEAGHGSLWPTCRVLRRAARRPSVSVIVPTRDRVDLLHGCLASIDAGATRVAAEIIVIDNDSTQPDALAYLRAIGRSGVRVLPMPGPFNFSRLNNAAAREARGDYLCFLNNDVEARDETWLEEMLSRHLDETVGAVGAKLLWPSAVVQHAGVVLGVNFSVMHAFNDRLDGDPGYADLLGVARSCSAVTAACMTTSRAHFFSVGGFDEILFPVNFNDVDYCLKLRNAGLRVVFTPHAKLIHRESVSRGRDDKADSAPRLARELRALRSKWGRALLEDPYYSPILSLDDPPFAALAWSPRPCAPRTDEAAPPAALPPGM